MSKHSLNLNTLPLFIILLSLFTNCWCNTQGDFQNILHETIHDGDKKKLESLIKEGTDIEIQDNDGKIPLHIAA